MMLERCLTAFNALGNDLTINEYRNPQEYKYLFSADANRKKFDNFTIKNVHKPVSCLKLMMNALVFFACCSHKNLR